MKFNEIEIEDINETTLKDNTENYDLNEENIIDAKAEDIDVKLVENAQCGDECAVDEIFDKYKNFVYLKARNYFLMGAEKEDLIQEGMIGLLKAIRGYDKNKLASFKTFASICIKRQLITAIKTANSQKNSILNNIVDIYSEDEEKNSEEEFILFGKGLSSYISYDPEEIYLSKEEIKGLIDFLKNNLSDFEYEVFLKMIDGLNYKDIANQMGKSSKSIDNAIQRIKRKSEQWIKEYKEI